MIEHSILSHVGNIRELNEDNFLADTLFLDDIRNYFNHSNQSEHGHHLFIVADGMGGTSSGEVASNLVVKEMSKLFKQIAIDSVIESKDMVKGMIKHRIDKINVLSCEMNPRMGSTLTGVYLMGDNFFTINLGDSSVFIYREGNFDKLTVDHTWARKLYEQGELTLEESKNYKKQNKLLRYIGINPEYGAVYPTISKDYTLEENDIILICSDGLTDMVSEKEMARILKERQHQGLEVMNRELLEGALSNGGVDNITSILVKKC